MESKQKLFFLPEPHTDFIYSVIAEERGLIGAVVILACFGVLAWRGLRTSLRAPDPFGAFLALGLTMMIVLQAFVNISVVLGLVQPAARLAQFSIEVLRPVPAVALIPVGLMVLGFGYSMEISLVAFACFWPVLIYGQAAITNIEPQLLEVSRVLRLSAFGRVTKIVLPAALPRYFVGFRLSAAVALIIAVTVEIAANPLGLGYELMVASQSLQPARMFAFLLWIGLIGWGLNWVLLFAQRRLFGQITLAAARAR